MSDSGWKKVKRQRTVDRSSDRVHDAWVRTDAPDKRARRESVEDQAFQPGRESTLLDHLINMIEEADGVVVISSFIIASPEIEQAILEGASRGLRVYLMTASEQRLDRDPKTWSETDRERADEHRLLLDRLAGHVLVRTAAGFHAKVVVTDPLTRPRGLLLTANLVYVDLEANLEVAVPLDDDEVVETFRVLRWAFWEMAEHEVTEPGRLQAVAAGDVVPWRSPSAPVVVANEHDDSISSSIVDEIRNSDDIVISNFGWTVGHPVVTALLEAVRTGVTVTVLARTSDRAKRASNALLELVRAGARVLGHRRLHAKVVLLEDGRVLVHSSNFVEYRHPGLELGVWLDGARAESVRTIVDEWVENAPWELVTDSALRAVGDRVIEIGDGQWKERNVVNCLDVRLPEIDAESALALVGSPQIPTSLPTGAELARSVRYVWNVKPPRLESGSREVHVEDVDGGEGRTSFQPKVFDERGGRRVVAVMVESELPAAKRLMKRVNAEAVVVRKSTTTEASRGKQP